MASHIKRVRVYFRERRAMSVSNKDIEGFVAHLKDQGKANAAINRSLQFLAVAYRYAATVDPPKLRRAINIQKLDVRIPMPPLRISRDTRPAR
jgi:hypothetical protein